MSDSKPRKILYGGDYNPDQWPRDVWPEDMRLFRMAGIDVATLPVFSWALLQPDELRYDFGWLDAILKLLEENGIRVCMATSTAAVPPWMARRYPDVLQVDFQGRQRKFGQRHNFCPNSPSYRRFSRALAKALAERYRAYPGLVAWHVNNEYGGGGGPCGCDTCARAFRVWLQRRYGSLEEVNLRWNTAFWGHTYYDWEEIVPPNLLSEVSEWGPRGPQSHQPGQSLDYARFFNDSVLACYRNEYDVLKEVTPGIPVTTNFMGPFKPLNYFSWAPFLDMVSWDCYPREGVHPAHIAFRHDLMRGVKAGQPFWLMEQTPNQLNWVSYPELRRPGEMRLWSWQAVARGADSVMFFQLRRSRAGHEQFHGAVIDHAGHEDTRTFREVAGLGAELARLGEAPVDARVRAGAAVFFDWENWWAQEFASGISRDLRYLPLIEKYHKALWDNGAAVDLVGPGHDLSRYRLLVLPAAFLLQPGYAAKLEKFVEGGGLLLATFGSGMVDDNMRVGLGGTPAELRRLLGLWVEESDALPAGKSNRLELAAPLGEVPGSAACGLLCDLVRLEGAEALAAYGEDFYRGLPALTRHAFGAGQAWYLATDPEEDFLRALMAHLAGLAGLEPVLRAPPRVEAVERVKDGKRLLFVLNHNPDAVEVDLGGVRGRELLSGAPVGGRQALPGRGVWIIQREG